jgi:hypothetical protein
MRHIIYGRPDFDLFDLEKYAVEGFGMLCLAQLYKMMGLSRDARLGG